MLTQKCNGEMWFEKYLRALWEYCVNLVMHVGLTNFILNCSTGYFFCSIHTWKYFPLFLWGVLYIWFYYAPWFWFDPETGTECLLRNLLLLFPRLLWSRYTLLFPALFLRSSYLLVLYLWLCSIRLSYGIDNSTAMIQRFALDKMFLSRD